MRKPRPWRSRARRAILDHPILCVAVHELEAEQGPPQTRDAIVIESRDWVNVVAVVGGGENAELVLIRQWRYGIAEETLEIPGGIVEPDEEPAETARRELLEESGYACSSVEPLGVIQPNPALFSNRCHIFLATGLEWQGRPEGDGEEEIEVVLRPLRSIPDAVRSGEIQHALVVAGLHFFDLRRRTAPADIVGSP